MLPQLLLTKRIFLEGCSYLTREDPISCGIAISMFQDAAELYIWTLIKSRGISTKDQAGFVSNIETLQKAGIPVPESAKLLELNKARVGFKHYGNLPAPDDAKKYQTHIEDFLRAATLEHYAQKFDEISLSDVVTDSAIRERLKAAEQRIAETLLPEAAAELAIAKELALGKFSKYVPVVDRHLRETDRVLNGIDGVHVDSFAYLTHYLSSLREACLVALLRLPLTDYAFLWSTLPRVYQTEDRKWHVKYLRVQYTENDCRRVISCIVNLCIQSDTLLKTK